MASNPHKVTVDCESCAASGIIPDQADAKVGIVCAGCGGLGHRILTFAPFEGRRKLKGIDRVRRSGQGISAFSPDPSPDAGVSYADFLKGKHP